MKELFSDNLGLFQIANTLEFSYKINQDSKYIDSYLTMFYFFGKMLAKALFDRIPLNICLNRSIFRAILGQNHEYDYRDLEEFKFVDYNVRIIFNLPLNRSIIV